MTDYSRRNFPKSSFVKEYTAPDEVPTAFTLPAPTIAGSVNLNLFRAAIEALTTDGLTDYNNNNSMHTVVDAYEADKKPNFSEALKVLAQQMVALAAN